MSPNIKIKVLQGILCFKDRFINCTGSCAPSYRADVGFWVLYSFFWRGHVSGGRWTIQSRKVQLPLSVCQGKVSVILRLNVVCKFSAVNCLWFRSLKCFGNWGGIKIKEMNKRSRGDTSIQCFHSSILLSHQYEGLISKALQNNMPTDRADCVKTSTQGWKHPHTYLEEKLPYRGVEADYRIRGARGKHRSKMQQNRYCNELKKKQTVQSHQSHCPWAPIKHTLRSAGDVDPWGFHQRLAK